MRVLTISLVLIWGLVFSSAVNADVDSGRESINLDEAIRLALDNNDEINALRNEVKSARASVRKARANYMFNLSATGEISRLDTFPDPSTEGSPFEGIEFTSSDITKSLTFNFVQPISTFGLIPASIRAAKGNLISKDGKLKQKEQEIALSVIESFYAVFLTDRSVAIQIDEVGRNKLALEHAEKRFKAGKSPGFDVIRSEVDLAQAEEKLVTSRKNAESSLLMFQRLLGTTEKYYPEFISCLDVPSWDISIEDCVEKALVSRPDIQQLKAGIYAQNAVISLNRLRPGLNFIASLKYADESNSFTGKNSWAWFLKLNVPLFDSRAKHAVNEARGTRDALESTLENIISLVEMEVKTNYLAIFEAKARIESSSKIYEQAKEALHMAEVGYREGVVTYLDLVSTRNQSTSAELNKLKALTDYHIALARMMKSIGSMPGEEIDISGD
ncbi:TolC family protein [bacterium]|nr:TolC family protein [bacterium]MBU1024756.1 TolC family protein [bacterium]